MKRDKTVGFKVTEEAKNKYEDVKAISGLDGEDLLLHFCSLYEVQSSTCAPAVSGELVAVKQALKQAEDVVIGFLNIANSDKQVAVKQAEESNKALNTVVKDLHADIALLKDQLEQSEESRKALLPELEAKGESLKSAVGKIEDTNALRDAWAEREKSLATRIAELDVEANSSRKLKAELQDCKSSLTEINNLLEIQKLENRNLNETTTVLQQEHADLKKSYETLREEKMICRENLAAAQANERVIESLEKQIEHLERSGKELKETLSLERSNKKEQAKE